MEQLKEKLLSFMVEEAYKPMQYDELLTVLRIKPEDQDAFSELLNALEEEGIIIKTKKHRYGLTVRMGLVVGRFQGNERGFGFVLPEDDTMEDIYISVENQLGALHGDRIIVRPTAMKSNRKLEGEVIRVIHRANTQVVGVFETNGLYGYVIPDNRKISVDFFIPKTETMGAENGQKVVVQVTHFSKTRRNPEGKIIEILGNADDVGTDILAIIRQYGIRETFPQEVLTQAEHISEEIDPKEIKKRVDLREKPIITIDGEDAKDLDDAVCVEILPNGNYLLGVHIADVSHYVKEGSPLDKEAYLRATSVYLVDRVIPMLPKKLSNGICSLNQDVDRLTFSVEMEIDKNGDVIDHRIFNSVIHSKARMTYTNVTRILEDKDPTLLKQYESLVPEFERMQELAMILRKRRTQRGSIDFDFPEAKILMDENGKPYDVKKYEITISNKIIEEFMLICNETVAEEAVNRTLPFVFRVHEQPDPEKVAAFSEICHHFGYSLKIVRGEISPKMMQLLMEKIKGTKEERALSTLMLRSLMKAKYAPDNFGHFGLAADFYCHFTSPIRRYPDLAIHRILKETAKGKTPKKRLEQLRKFTLDASRQSSECEVAAQDAERDTDDLKKAEFMQDKVGETFEGIISGIQSFGMFVELENTVEGMVRVSTMEDDYYTFDETHFLLMGEYTKKIYRIGDTVKVRLVKVDVQARKIEFMLEELLETKPIRRKFKPDRIPTTPKKTPKNTVDKRPSKGKKGDKAQKPMKKSKKKGKKNQ